MKYIKKQDYKPNGMFLPKCTCSACGVLTEEELQSIYKSNFIIAEDSSQIFNVFTEHVKRY